MKKLFFIIGLASITVNAQQKEIKNINSDISQIKSDISAMKEDIASIKSENIYFKKILDINKPIVEQKKDNVSYRITKVEGDSKSKNILIHFLTESLSETKSIHFDEFILVDLEGNQYDYTNFNYNKSTNFSNKLFSNVPVKLTAAFKNIEGQPSFIKLFKFRESNSRETLEFRDLKIDWK